MGRCNEACPPHSWGGVGAADGGAGRDLSSPFMGRCNEACPPHSWGGVGAADGGAELKTGRSHTSGSVLRSFHCTRFAQNGPNFPLETRVLRKTLQNREVPR